MESDNYTRVSEHCASRGWPFEDWDTDGGSGMDRMAKLTKDDVVRVANKYFGDNYVAGLPGGCAACGAGH